MAAGVGLDSLSKYTDFDQTKFQKYKNKNQRKFIKCCWKKTKSHMILFLISIKTRIIILIATWGMTEHVVELENSINTIPE